MTEELECKDCIWISEKICYSDTGLPKSVERKCTKPGITANYPAFIKKPPLRCSQFKHRDKWINVSPAFTREQFEETVLKMSRQASKTVPYSVGAFLTLWEEES